MWFVISLLAVVLVWALFKKISKCRTRQQPAEL